MSLKKLTNITPAELKSKGVVSLADKPNAAASYGVGGLSPTALKLWFDQLSKLLADKINAIQDALSGDNAAEYIKLILTGLDSTNETGEYSLQDLCDAFKDGKFAEYLQLYGSAAAENLSSLQAIVNAFALDISETKETADAAKEAAETAENNRITATAVEYQEGTSGTSAPTGAWSSAIPAVQEGRYLWTRVTLTFASGSTAVFYSVGKIGARGDDVYSFVIRDGNLIQVKASAADDEANLGRVQGGGIFYSTASSGTSIAKSTLTPTGLVPLVGDCVVFPNGDLRKITSVSSTNVTCGSVSANFKGDKGDTGTTGSIVKTAAEWESQNPVLGAGVFGYDSTNGITKTGDGTTAWKTLPILLSTDFSFGKASWSDIAALSESGSADKYFSVGDEKTIELTTGEQVTLVILGFNHDDLTSGGKAGMTIGMKNLLATTYRMNATGTNAGGWDESEMRTSTMATLLSQLPFDLQSVIKRVNKKAMAGGASTTITTSADKLWLLAEVEVDGRTSAGYADEGEQYEYWKTVKDGTALADRIKYLSNGSGSADSWWLRTTFANNSFYFSCITNNGVFYTIGANSTCGVSFGFCV